MNQPFFTIVTPVWNRADCIARCLDSVARQFPTEFNIEHVVVNDGSTDNTAEIINGYVNRYPHIRTIDFRSNRGVNAARNAAIASAQGKFIIILDSDDMLVEGAINTIYDAIAGNPQYSHYMFVPNDRRDYIKSNELLCGGETKEIEFRDFLLRHVDGDFIHVISTDVMRAFPFNEILRIYEGLTFMQFYKYEQKVLFVNQMVTIRDRGRTDSVSHDYICTSDRQMGIQTQYLSSSISLFGQDYIEFGGKELLYLNYCELFLSYILLMDYRDAKIVREQMRKYNFDVSPLLHAIYITRSGWILKHLLVCYRIVKYNTWARKLK